MKTLSLKIALTLFVLLVPVLPGAGIALAQDDEKRAEPATPKPKGMEIQLSLIHI